MQSWLIALAIIVGLIGITIMANQIALAIFIIVVGVVAVIIYLYLQKEKYNNPVEELKQNILRCCQNPNGQLGYLMLSGGTEDDISHQERIKGKIIGFTKMTFKHKENEAKKYSKWNTLYVIAYIPRGMGFIASLKAFVFSLPLLDNFMERRLFACNTEQLKGNEMTFGDIKIYGTSTIIVGIFEMLNVKDLDKDYIMNFITADVKRIVFKDFLSETSMIVKKAISSDGEYQKILEVVRGLPQQKDEFGLAK